MTCTGSKLKVDSRYGERKSQFICNHCGTHQDVERFHPETGEACTEEDGKEHNFWRVKEHER